MIKYSLLTIMTFLLGSVMSFAQTARIQVIHNSADAAASVVDVYLDNTLLFDDFAFREASSFLDAPAGTPFVVGIAPSNSTSVMDTITSFNVTLMANETYVVVANGIVSATGYNPSPAFELDVFALGRESSANPGETDVLVAHGSTDAPFVDVQVPGAGTVVDNLGYGDFQGYLELANADYTLNVTDSTGSVVVASFQAPLQTLGLADSALVVVASGFLDPSQNSMGEPFGLFVALPGGGQLIPLPQSTARVQVIHNSADAAASTVDVYLDDALLIDDFAFRSASPFIDAPAGTSFSIGIAPSNSTSVTDTITSFDVTLMANETYVVVANGIVSATGYNPSPAFGLDVFAMGRESSANSGETDVLVAHGSTDAPFVDVQVPGAGTIVDNLGYGEFQGYLELANADYTLNVTDSTGSVVVASFQAPLQTLGLADSALVVVASGFLDPSQNSMGEAFGLFVALPSGGQLIALPQTTARVQVIHNSADAAASTVDVYLDDALLIDDFAFRSASPFIDAPAEVNITIGIAPGNSTSVDDTIASFNYTLAANEKYMITANGIVSATGYNPSPGFGLSVFAPAREEASMSGNSDILVMHGSTDAPTVDVVAVGVGTIVDDISYGEYNMGYLEVATADLILEVYDASGSTLVAAYQAPLATLGLEDSAMVVVASGFLDPSQNSNGDAFGLYVALPSGGDLIALPVVSALENRYVERFNMFPNPVSNVLNIDLDLNEGAQMQMTIIDITGRQLRSRSLNLNSGVETIQISTQDLPQGSYLIRLGNEDGFINRRFVKSN